ncbi:MAG: NADH-quinone oxidoreductase subunit C [Dehalococcoidia bacterium]
MVAVTAATAFLSGHQVAERITASLPGAVVEATEGWVVVAAERLVETCRLLHDDAELDARFLALISGVDRYDYFEVVYQLSSLAKNQRFALKVYIEEHEEPEIPSVSSIWLGAHLQEREIYDLMGIRFSGHPDLKRLFLWEGFPGFPLRKDFMTLPEGFKPGLQRFPKEDPESWGGEARVP